MSWDEEEGPWGRKNNSSSWKGKKPNVDDLLRNGHNKLKGFLSGGSGNNFLMGAGILFLVGAFWLNTCIYSVREDERAVVLRFGKWVRTENPGLNFFFFPFESILKPSVMRVNQIDSGLIRGRGVTSSDDLDDSLMLTGDENILDITFTVLWRIKDVRQFLFHTRNPELTIKATAEAAVREIIAQSPRAYAQTEGRNDLNHQAEKLLQSLMDNYGTGVEIIDLQLQKVDAPGPVADAFLDVQRARADEDRLKNEAEAYRNDILPRGRGEAQQMLEEAEGYHQSRIAIAQGEVSEFEQVQKEYRQASVPEVVKERMYQETMQEVMRHNKKIITDPKIITYFPLPSVASSVQGAKQ